jgi:DNA-binding NtrC family response regulator
MNSKPVRILVADDERTLSFFLQRSLEADDSSYSVETSHSGADALVKIVRIPFDLVIADLRMPGVDGLRLVEHARNLNSSTQAILMTAYGSDGAEAAAKEMGVEYITKPFAMEDMKRLVRKTIRTQEKERER